MNRDFDYLVKLGSNFLAHYGVKGMKWRRRRNSQDPLTARKGKDTKDRRPNQRSGELNRRVRKRPKEKILGRDKGVIGLARNTLQDVAYKQKQKGTRRGKR